MEEMNLELIVAILLPDSLQNGYKNICFLSKLAKLVCESWVQGEVVLMSQKYRNQDANITHHLLRITTNSNNYCISGIIFCANRE